MDRFSLARCWASTTATPIAFPAGFARSARTPAIAASGLIELSQLETDPTRGQSYGAAATNILDSLASPTYLSSTADSAGLLMHGARRYPGENRTYMFGDYYFIEALLRYSNLPG